MVSEVKVPGTNHEDSEAKWDIWQWEEVSWWSNSTLVDT